MYERIQHSVRHIVNISKVLIIKLNMQSLSHSLQCVFYLFLFKKIVLNIFIQFSKVTLHLQLLQNIVYIPCVVQYILVAYFTPNSFYLSLLHPNIAPPLLPTGNHQFVLYICESASFLLYSLICCIFQIPHISNIIQYLISQSDLLHLA